MGRTDQFDFRRHNEILGSIGIISWDIVRLDLSALGQAKSTLYHRLDRLLRELANPDLHEILAVNAVRIELWDRHTQHVRWVVAASASATITQAALDSAITEYPGQRLTLRKGILVIREHVPKGQ